MDPYTRLEGIYDGQGVHLGGIYPPLAVDNVLTQFCLNSSAERPFRCAHQVEPGGHNLGLIYMARLGIAPAEMIGDTVMLNVLALLVTALDRGEGIVVHADRDDAAQWLVATARVWMGGGHA